LIKKLQKLMGCKFDFLMPPFGGSVMAGDQSRAMQAAEVPVDEGVTGLRVVGRSFG
jgi:hypothetical protein